MWLCSTQLLVHLPQNGFLRCAGLQDVNRWMSLSKQKRNPPKLS